MCYKVSLVILLIIIIIFSNRYTYLHIYILLLYRLNFEFPSTGGIISHGEFVTVKLLRYITEADYALMGAEFLFAAMLIYYFVEEAMEIRVGKFDYFTSFWNCLDVFVILVIHTYVLCIDLLSL